MPPHGSPLTPIRVMPPCGNHSISHTREGSSRIYGWWTQLSAMDLGLICTKITPFPSPCTSCLHSQINGTPRSSMVMFGDCSLLRYVFSRKFVCILLIFLTSDLDFQLILMILDTKNIKRWSKKSKELQIVVFHPKIYKGYVGIHARCLEVSKPKSVFFFAPVRSN